MSTSKFKKGMAVKIKRESTNWRDLPSMPDMWRDRTEADHEEWLASDESKGMTSGGDTKLDSPSRYRRTTTEDELFKVVRARVTARKGWHDIGGCAEVEDENGVRWFVKREYMH